MSFYLSLGLFSSFSIDAGTRLLLKTIAQQDIIPEDGSVLDAGCGTGVIAVSLKKRFPELNITAADRDALALYFTEKNAARNKVQTDTLRIEGGLLPGSLRNPLKSGSSRFDLIVSNIPAKAGLPVIADFLQNCGFHLTDEGKAAVVIVSTLADFAFKTLEESGAEILYRESNKQYAVFHFIPGKEDKKRSFNEIYCRSESDITGFFGLPEFDSISYSTKVALEVLRNNGCRGTALFWNPGIGHLPCNCSEVDEFILASPDLLQLKSAAFNLASDHRLFHLPKFCSLLDNKIGTVNNIVAQPDFITGAYVEEEIIQTSVELLSTKGRLIISGNSSDIAKIDKIKKGFVMKQSIKYRGNRAILLEKL